MFPEASVGVAAQSTPKLKRWAWKAILGAALGVAVWVMVANSDRLSLTDSTSATTEAELDRRLQSVATAALSDTHGTIVVIDPQTGRIRAVVNPEIAFGESLPPGSTIKPFTMIAAMNSGVVQQDSTTLCREEYSHDTFHTVCSHPRDLGPLNPTDALAYSCNYYFGKVGERLSEPAFAATLAQFGFGKKTGVNFHGEAGGKLVRGAWRSQNAIGETENFYATPIQLLNAYSALVNGGRLFVPQVTSPESFQPRLQTELPIDNEQRMLLVKGMRGAVRYGTAETASLYSLPNYIFGKTGTATQINGFRTQGWFVGFASDLGDDAPADTAVEPKNIRLGVLVFLHKAHGSDAGKVARRVFEEFSRASNVERPEIKPAVAVGQPSGSIRVRSVKENVTRTMPLENYILGVVAAEGSTENESAALQALAIASRTYALSNIGRHSSEGYDLCSTTHCQRFEASTDIAPHLREAVYSTAGETVRDSRRQLADAYFSASCGGVTANVATLWGSEPRSYLRGVEDGYCETGKHGRWTDVISAHQLQKALESDPRTSAAGPIESLQVRRRDDTGRAHLVSIQGNREITISGWEFKIIVGRALGWNLLKSSRFEVSLSGSDFIFRGSGFGHGLGLCQEGAHGMAARGASYKEILSKYFPGTTVSTEVSNWSSDVLWRGDAIKIVGSSKFQRNRRMLSGEQVRISFPASTPQREIESLLSEVESHRRSLNARLSSVGLFIQVPAVEIHVNETTGDFVGRTGQPPWAAAASKGNRIELQPLNILRRRNVLSTTVRHELVHVVINAAGGRTSRWLAEGLAIHFAGEGALVSSHTPRAAMSAEQIEQKLSGAASATEMKTAYAAAYRAVQQLISAEGESNVWRRISR
ncbi:MAG TPA: SpoIID/LytB domain-containing protein [Pyrinomonadaceae bacterium]|nr:SpoIID/LytB domain-containing protein [Pyrinomonadaceae bacterium]